MGGDTRLGAQAAVEQAFLRMSLEPQGSGEHAGEEAERALLLFQKLDDDLGLSKAWFLRADVEALAGRFERTRDKALSYARRLGDERREEDIREYKLLAEAHGPRPLENVIGRCEDELRRVAEAEAEKGIGNEREP